MSQKTINHSRRPDVSPVLWLALPLASLALALLSPLLGWQNWHRYISSEFGFFETATVALLLPAMVCSFIVFLRRRTLPRGVGWWMLLFAAACLFFAGEEASWGQHWFGFATPQALMEINRQHEFNLHNLKDFNILNNVPRLIAETAMVVGGLVLPLALRPARRKNAVGQRLWHWMAPTPAIIPAALLASVWTIPEKIIDAFFRGTVKHGSYLSMALISRSGEVKEYFIAMAMAFYAVSIFLRQSDCRKEPPVSADSAVG